MGKIVKYGCILNRKRGDTLTSLTKIAVVGKSEATFGHMRNL